MAKRGAALEFAVLGLLHDTPMHGYELRKELNALLGWGRVLSYGTLYPCLKALGKQGYIVADEPADVPASRGRRGKIVYRLTAEGKEHFADLLAAPGPSSWEDESFGIHFAFFSRTDSRTRVRILEGRRSRLEERLDKVRTATQRRRERLDAYTLELQRHGLESVEREVRWLTGLIDAERSGRQPGDPQAQANTKNPPTGGGQDDRRGQ
ncbi:PadR family transcriptional regulator [Mumia zhuanghuii]|uniref:PadR family transcriptional regulator n=2 Tax=Mumia TaxID=1546255 RepID=A0ABW1QJX3_9ACTN|nr:MULTISPECIES: PadR family transcriptional regulator [Mumia]KAA1424834.1 PadR family transcriptional regulator [Mumia zhuanghuii]